MRVGTALTVALALLLLLCGGLYWRKQAEVESLLAQRKLSQAQGERAQSELNAQVATTVQQAALARQTAEREFRQQRDALADRLQNAEQTGDSLQIEARAQLRRADANRREAQMLREQLQGLAIEDLPSTERDRLHSEVLALSTEADKLTEAGKQSLAASQQWACLKRELPGSVRKALVREIHD